MERKRLSDILRNADRDELTRAWSEAKAAEDFGLLPPGEYIARIAEGTATTAKTGTPGFMLTFQVLEGEYAGRRFWHSIWLTPAAIPMAKRDLGKLGVTSLDQLDKPLPEGMRAKVKLSLRRDDNGNESNRVSRFDVVDIDPPGEEPFAPSDNEPPDSGNGSSTSFAFGDEKADVGPYAERR